MMAEAERQVVTVRATAPRTAEEIAPLDTWTAILSYLVPLDAIWARLVCRWWWQLLRRDVGLSRQILNNARAIRFVGWHSWIVHDFRWAYCGGAPCGECYLPMYIASVYMEIEQEKHVYLARELLRHHRRCPHMIRCNKLLRDMLAEEYWSKVTRRRFWRAIGSKIAGKRGNAIASGASACSARAHM
jgi:hypothetical protein